LYKVAKQIVLPSFSSTFAFKGGTTTTPPFAAFASTSSRIAASFSRRSGSTFTYQDAFFGLPSSRAKN
jgi:hypothetical protein